MKAKMLITVVLLGLAGAALVVAAPGQGVVATSSAVQIPDVLKLAFEGLLFAGLFAGFSYILKTIGLDLTGYAKPLAATLSAFLLGLAQGWIDVIPAQYDLYVEMVLQILVIVLSGLGVLYVASSRKDGESLL